MGLRSFPVGYETELKEVVVEREMFLKVQLPWNVVIPAENLDAKGLMLQKAIVIRLMDEFATKKATKDLGYFLAVTTLDKGEILEGVVHKVLKHGVLLRCGPVENIYLSSLKMPDYQHMPGENPFFLNDKSSKIEKDVVVDLLSLGLSGLKQIGVSGIGQSGW
ncbi:hypothetical protein FEM48_ZijujUnG0041600 [Ziziphus jujuba var. spinosa]|uniref:DNA-directed RNA polymerase subunit n=1 Tax=Ziziphus jujuba var. spinosa TaxID=714518 RepID=A0A978U9B2_ZIZJJ|nr:hypothetical protein FEM48_ZijujUnG0041600 [Ziziphus jujuba var. spinosa]